MDALPIPTEGAVAIYRTDSMVASDNSSGDKQHVQCSLCATWIVAIARKAVYSATQIIHVVAAFARRATVRGAFRATRAEHRRAVERGAVVAHPVRQARAGAVGVVTCSCPAAVTGA